MTSVEDDGTANRVGELSDGGVLSATATGVAIGTHVLGTFEITEHIATGGMGEVYRGVNIHTNQAVAIKIVLASLAHDEKILSLFQKEATVLGELHHEAIVRYHLFTIDPTIRRACLIMEYVSGEALLDRLTHGPVPLEEVRVLLRRLASGLQKAHDLGVVHRDLSPDNVIITDGVVSHAKLIDFGIAKSANFGGGTLLGGQFAGKFNYVSPEQLGRFKGVITPRSDIYSLALVVAAACLGHPIDMGESPAEAVESRTTVPDLEGVYPELRPLLQAMLQPDPSHRPSTMAEVIAALDDPSRLAPVADVTPSAPRAAPIRDTVVPPPAMSQPPAFSFTDAPRGEPGAGTVVSAAPVMKAPAADQGGTSAMTVMSAPPQPPAAAALQADQSPFGAAPSAPVPTPAPSEPAAETPQAPQAAAPTRKRSPLVPMISVAALIAVAGGAAWISGAMSSREAAPSNVTVAPRTQEVDPTPTVVTPREPTTETAATQPPASDPTQSEQISPDKVSSDPAAPIDTATASAPADTAPVSGSSNSVAEPETDAVVAALAEQVRETTEAEVEASSPQTAADPMPAPSRMETLSPRTAWLASYDMPDCSYVRPLEEEGETFAIEGFGVAVDPFMALDTAFAEAHGNEAQIGLRKITEAQCPAIDFARRTVGPDKAPIPELEIQGDILRPGETTPLRGRLDGVEGLALRLILIDDRGGSYDITSLLRSGADGAPVFDLAVQIGARGDTPEIRPNLILAVGTPTALDGVDIEAGQPVGPILAAIDAQLAERGEGAVAALGYFRLEDT